MKPRQGRRFRKSTRYVHQRSEGMTDRRNGGSRYQMGDRNGFAEVEQQEDSQ